MAYSLGGAWLTHWEGHGLLTERGIAYALGGVWLTERGTAYSLGGVWLTHRDGHGYIPLTPVLH